MRIFKTKWFARFARKEDIPDKNLLDAVSEAENGLHDGRPGGNLIKKRVARAGEGKRGGYRTIIIYSAGVRAVFVYGFAKNVRANLSDLELRAYQELAKVFLRMDDADVATAVNAGEMLEVNAHGEKVQK